MGLPDATKGIQNLFKAMYSSGAPQTLLDLVHMRASQINGCGACIHAGVQAARKAGESDDRLLQLPGWRDADCFTDAERAALKLTEAVTRLADRGEVVDDQLWDEVADHFDERELSAVILMIATTNMVNRINTTIRVPAGTTWE
ncbi:carboxymuconolactone decarboxylase family protein [Actinomadura vinacea]|uniref:Carboxymuconolactone decarboxylase family protein n=1 Tax=Actinomadura vinacea TaxID=115336 RepID=A0ABP5XJS9_9ACTN